MKNTKIDFIQFKNIIFLFSIQTAIPIQSNRFNRQIITKPNSAVDELTDWLL